MKFDYEHDGFVEKGHFFILAEAHRPGIAFQLICIEGYHAGSLEGYIRPEGPASYAITKAHLIEELKRNFLNILWESFTILPKGFISSPISL
tara:strand:- start:1040 stop:1315 length:276 start_codon:yes stop_codon:yes gene_type:complete